MAEGHILELRRAGSWRRAAAWAMDGIPSALVALGLVAVFGSDPRLLLPPLLTLALAAFVYQLLGTAPPMPCSPLGRGRRSRPPVVVVHVG